MFDTGGSWPEIDAEAATQLLRRASRADVALALKVLDSQAAILILDAEAKRLRYASAAALGWARAISDPDGRLVAGLRIGEQIIRVRSQPGAPVLLRLNLDLRRIAPPALVTLLRTDDEAGRAYVILIAATPLPRLRTVAARTADASPTLPDPATDAPGPAKEVAPEIAIATADVPPLAVRQRFIWRSGADGTLSELSRPRGDVLRERMQGHRWQALSDAGILRDAGGLIAALDRGRTFRAIPVTLIAPDGSEIEMEISGSPVDRGSQDFRGFGQIRAIGSCGLAEAQPASAEPIAAAPNDGAEIAVTQAAPEPEVEAATPADVQSADIQAENVQATALAESAPAAADPSLSSNEHAAFREIARALGARFAGDEGHTAPEERGIPCAVMPFPVPSGRAGEPVNSDARSGTIEPDGAMLATLERLPAGVLVYRDNRVLFANRRLLDMTGYAVAEALDRAGGIERLFRGLVPHTRESGDIPIVLTASDGLRHSVLVEHSVLDWAGQPAELLLARDAEPSEGMRASTAAAIAQDFADRRAMDALRVLDTLEDGVATLDGQARILTLNRSAAAIFGVDPREVVGASLLSLFAPENAVNLLGRLHAEPGAPPPEPAPVTARATGAALRVKVLPMVDDRQRRLCAVITDASALNRMDDEAASDARLTAEMANQQKSEFLAKVSHEIRTPISGILGFADLMLSEQFGPLGSERYRAYLQDIHASGTHALDLINDLLDLARIEAGRLDMKVTEIPLNEVVARCVALLQPQASRERILLRTSFSSELVTLFADERSVRQAALNVIANAIAFTEAGGQVIVSTTMADRGEIALRVRDTGIGMTPDEVDVALQPFRQVRPLASRKGSGLGLPLTKALVEANHGRFRISSRKDEGTLVEMLFPVDAATRRA